MCSFFFYATATAAIYTLSLHDALPIWAASGPSSSLAASPSGRKTCCWSRCRKSRSEEHTSELQSHSDLVCRLLLEKKKHRTELHPDRREPRRAVVRRATRRPGPHRHVT